MRGDGPAPRKEQEDGQKGPQVGEMIICEAHAAFEVPGGRSGGGVWEAVGCANLASLERFGSH